MAPLHTTLRRYMNLARRVVNDAPRRRVVAASPFFDAVYYAAAAGIDPVRVDPVSHYLKHGEARGLRPSAKFDPAFYIQTYPDVRAAGIGPLWHYLTVGSAQNRSAQEWTQTRIAAIRESGWFDERYYAGQAGAGMDADPLVHYLEVGEGSGLRPHPHFDPAYYRELYPDTNGARSVLEHYVLYGASEQRLTCRPLDRLAFPGLDPLSTKPVVVVVLHEASRTGAPILGWNILCNLRAKYRVVTVLLHGGELQHSFVAVSDAVVGPIATGHYKPHDYDEIAERIIDVYRPLYVLANSIATLMISVPLARHCTNSLVLVHEFSSYVGKAGTLSDLYACMRRVIFPAGLLLQSALRHYPELDPVRTAVLPQGRSALPPAGRGTIRAAATSLSGAELARRLRPEGCEDAFLVVGLGTVELRKGVDLFLSAAAACSRLGGRRIRFVWIGAQLGDDPMSAHGMFTVYLNEQIVRSGLGECFEWLRPVSDLDTVYAEADALFLSSRLDPLPNVSIDAACCGKPVVCFDGASGMAEILKVSAETNDLVLPYLDVAAAADLIRSLAADPERYHALCAAIRRRAEAVFDMTKYVAAIDALALETGGQRQPANTAVSA